VYASVVARSDPDRRPGCNGVRLSDLRGVLRFSLPVASVLNVTLPDVAMAGAAPNRAPIIQYVSQSPGESDKSRCNIETSVPALSVPGPVRQFNLRACLR
jgi:hypothetical protein